MTTIELIGNLKTFEIKKQQDMSKSKNKKKKNLVLKFTKEAVSVKDKEQLISPNSLFKSWEEQSHFLEEENPADTIKMQTKWHLSQVWKDGSLY